MNRILLKSLILFLSITLHADTWETAIAGVLTTPPAEGLDGRIYCTADDRALHALNGATGREYWNYRPGRKLTGFTAVSPDGIIYIHTIRNELIAVSPGGWELWRKRLANDIICSPSIDPYGRIVLLTSDYVIHVFDRLGSEISFPIPSDRYEQIYNFENRLFLQTPSQLNIYSFRGDLEKEMNVKVEKVIINKTEFFFQLLSGQWMSMAYPDFTYSEIPAPVKNSTIYPEAEVLITDQGRVVSGRKDWFMEAYQEGIESYHSFYQPGCNSSRTNGPRIDLISRNTLRYSETGFTEFILQNNIYLQTILIEMEKYETFNDLILDKPDYDIFLMSLLRNKSRITPYRENPEEPDQYSQYRIYMLLTRWGDLRTRDALLSLCRLEKDPAGLAILIKGLGKIGIDRDGRSSSLLYDLVRQNRGDELIYQSVLSASYRIARYNGQEAMLTFFQILEDIQIQTRSDSTRNMITQIMKEITG